MFHQTLKGPYHRNFPPLYERYHPPEHHTQSENFVFTPFTPKIGDLTENVRLEGPKKQAIVSCSGPEKQGISLL